MADVTSKSGAARRAASDARARRGAAVPQRYRCSNETARPRSPLQRRRALRRGLAIALRARGERHARSTRRIEMKKTKTKKLSLNKITLTNLTLNRVHGGLT